MSQALTYGIRQGDIVSVRYWGTARGGKQALSQRMHVNVCWVSFSRLTYVQLVVTGVAKAPDMQAIIESLGRKQTCMHAAALTGRTVLVTVCIIVGVFINTRHRL